MTLTNPARARTQQERFRAADHERTAWILDNPVVRQHEQALFAALEVGRGPVLEVGGGEGLTLRFRPELAALGYVGTDLHVDRARAIRDGAPGVGAAACNAVQLPFADGTFGSVLCRDVLHHLSPADQAAAVAEMARVLRADGTLCLVEPNAGRSPMVGLFSAAVRTERGALRFHAGSLGDLVRPHFGQVRVDHLEPTMLYRLLLHYRFGRPALGAHPVVRRALHAWEQVAQRLPASRWCYVRLTCAAPRRRASRNP